MPLVTRRLLTVSRLTFVVFVGLALMSPSWRVGPFTWWPIWLSPMLAGRPAAIGLLSLLPFLVVFLWLAGCVYLFLATRNRWVASGNSVPSSSALPSRKCGSLQDFWNKRPGQAIVPLAGLSLLTLSSLDWATDWRTLTQLTGLLLFWFVFLLSLYEKQGLLLPTISLIVAVQSGAAVLQFLLQRDLGLAFWGELELDPAISGASVLWARGRPWLRGYGLTAHPNVLGAMLAVLLLWLLAAYGWSNGRRRAWLTVVITSGLLGLFVTFSRAAWLGFAIGAMLDFGFWFSADRSKIQNPKSKTLLMVLPAALLLLLFGDLAAGRFLALDTPGESESISQRMEDMRLALALIARQPWQGVGAGNYLTAALPLNPTAETVHNVPLLVAAELGLPGLFLWLWLVLTPFRFWILDFGFWRCLLNFTTETRGPPRRLRWKLSPASHLPRASLRLALLLSPWLAMVVIGLFDNSLWLSAGWRGAMLFGLLAAGAVGGNR
ncbi:MAG: O-antigen ligase family protein [Chloroflexota bacterium]